MEIPSTDAPILIAQSGPLNGQQWTCRDDILLGRDPACDIIIPDRKVSRHHARISPQNGGYIIEDLSSKNGTQLNGERIDNGVYLHDGDVLQIALAQEFVYISADSTVPLGSMPAQAKTETCRLRLEKQSRRVWVGETELSPSLSVAQFRVLELLFDQEGQVVSRMRLTEEIWDAESALELSGQALDALIRRLRGRLAETNCAYEFIVTVRGHGLRLDNPES